MWCQSCDGPLSLGVRSRRRICHTISGPFHSSRRSRARTAPLRCRESSTETGIPAHRATDNCAWEAMTVIQRFRILHHTIFGDRSGNVTKLQRHPVEAWRGRFFARRLLRSREDYSRESERADQRIECSSAATGQFEREADAIEFAHKWAIDENWTSRDGHDPSKRFVGDSYATLQCLSGIGWKAINCAAARRPRGFGLQCVRCSS
ncbi:hypothetical protein SBC1_71910 (plasmid) [Caballeronia sp. SBC1]|jgi:hypothetical protein|nr:hypothetical protein SBC2_75020 [Caballeronia sp. SBC2]QIN67144.1 hypothetical protein SBC1_71910 [Caballeronia sp. SBC1]